MQTYSAAQQRALKIALSYFIISITWIFFSDWLLDSLSRDLPDSVVLALNISKGWIFMGVSSTLLYIALNRAFTSEQTVAQRTEELMDLYNNAPCGYHSIDAHGVIKKINDTELRWLGYSREEIVDKMNLEQLLAPEFVETFRSNMSRLMNGEDIRDIETALRRKDGSWFKTLVNISAIRDKDGRFLLTRTTLFDITERHKLEQALADHMQELQNLNQDLETFNSMISHDLSAPIRAARIMAEELSEEIESDGQKKRSQELGAWLKRAEGLIQNLLAFSRLMKKERRFEEVDLYAVTQEVVEECSQIYDLSDTAIHLSKLTVAWGDKAAIKQILMNLLSNAIKFSKDVNPPRIEITGGDEGEFTTVVVTDNGIGFATNVNEEQSQQSIYRVGGIKNAAGFRLGLFLVSHLIHRHGGSMDLQSTPGSGTSVKILLPNRKAI